MFELGDYAAEIIAIQRGDSLIGRYHNVGRKGPRTIPFRASRGTWEVHPGPAALLGRWDAGFESGFDQSPRVLEFSNGPRGLEGTVISNSGDYGLFWGGMQSDSFTIGHFDGSFVYLLTGALSGRHAPRNLPCGPPDADSVRRDRSSGKPHLTPPTAVTRADTSQPFHFGFPDLQGRPVTSNDARFRGKVVLLDHLRHVVSHLPRRRARAGEAVSRLSQSRTGDRRGVAFEVTGDSGIDARWCATTPTSSVFVFRCCWAG